MPFFSSSKNKKKEDELPSEAKGPDAPRPASPQVNASTLYFDYLWYSLKQRVEADVDADPAAAEAKQSTATSVADGDTPAGFTGLPPAGLGEDPTAPVEIVEAAVQEAAAAIQKQGGLEYSHRAAIRSLFFSSVGDSTLRDTFDGMLLPPPWRVEDYTEHIFTRDEVVAAAHAIPLDLRAVLVRMPMNLALKTGVYDARLRATMRRMCHLYDIPFSTIEQREEMLCSMDWAEEDQPKVHKGSKMTPSRALKIGAFTVVGGVALFFTGGLAAPLIAPAFGALIGATVSTVGVVGAAGAAMGGTIAAVFAGIVGVATQAAALAVLITPALTAANVTAIIGAGGAGLGAWKGAKRTAGVGAIKFRPLDSIEVLPPMKDQLEDLMSGDGGAESFLGVAADSTDKDEGHSGAFKGVIVPRHVRTVALLNIAGSPKVKDRRRVCAFAVDNDLQQSEKLVLKASYLEYGRWVYAPAKVVPSGAAGVSMATNKHNVPTGAGGCVCYVIEGHSNHNGYRVWLYAYIALTGTTRVSALVVPPQHSGTPQEFYVALQEASDSDHMTFQHHGIVVEARVLPKPHFVIRKSTAAAVQKNAAFHSREVEQRVLDLKQKLKTSHRSLPVVIKNNTSVTMDVIGTSVITGRLHPDAPPAAFIGSEDAQLIALCNTSMSPQGATAHIFLSARLPPAEGILAKLEEENKHPSGATPEPASAAAAAPDKAQPAPASSDEAAKNAKKKEDALPKTQPRPRHSLVRLGAEISSINNVLAAAVVCPGTTAMRSAPDLKLEKVGKETPSLKDEKHGIKITWEFDTGIGGLLFTLSELTAADVVEKTPKMALTIGVTGFITTLDHRRKLKDQQVALFQLPFEHNTSGLFTASEALVMQWEDKEQQRFANTVGLNVEDSVGTKVSKKAEKKVKKAVFRSVVYKTFMGAGVRAVEAMGGAFAMPLYAVWGADAIDNAYATLSNRSESAGVELAAALTSELRGHRPVTLVGFSFGCNVISECLRQLHKIGALGVVENAYLLGGIVPSCRSVWAVMREAVAGRLVNVYNRSDWLLHFIHRGNFVSTSGLSGLTKIAVPGVENIDCSSLVGGHSDYAARLDEILCLIPPNPTPQTMDLERTGAPGASVPVAERADAANRTYSSMTGPILSRVGACVVTVANRTRLPFVLLHFEIFGGMFDFIPPGTIAAANAGICGAVVDPAASKMGGFVAYGALIPNIPVADHGASPTSTSCPDSPATPTGKPLVQRSLLVVTTFFHFHAGKKLATGTTRAFMVTVPPITVMPWYDDEGMMERVRETLSALVHGVSEVEAFIESAPRTGTKCTDPHEFGEPAEPKSKNEDADEFDHLVLDLQWSADPPNELCKGAVRMLVVHPETWGINVTLKLDVDADARALLESQAGDETGAQAPQEAPMAVARCVPIEDLTDELQQVATATGPAAGAPDASAPLPFAIVNGSTAELMFIEFGDGLLDTSYDGARWWRFAPPVIAPQSAVVLALATVPGVSIQKDLAARGNIHVATCAFTAPHGRFHIELFLHSAPADSRSAAARHVDPAADVVDGSAERHPPVTTSPVHEVRLGCKCFFVPIEGTDDPEMLDGEAAEAGGTSSGVVDEKVVNGQRCVLLMLPARTGATPPSTPKSGIMSQWKFF